MLLPAHSPSPRRLVPLDAEGRLRFLLEAAKAFALASPDPTAVLDQLVRHAVEHLCDTCIIQLLDDQGDWRSEFGARDVDPGRDEFLRTFMSQASRRSADAPFSRRILRRGQALLVPQVDFARFRRALGPGFRPLLKVGLYHSVLVAPMRAIGGPVGVMFMARHVSSASFETPDVALVQDLADHAARAIQGALLYEEMPLELARRLEAEAGAKASEAKFRALVEATADVVWLADSAGNIRRDWLSPHEEIGLSPSQTSRADLRFVHEDDRERMRTGWRRAVETLSPVRNAEYRIRARSGKVLWVSTNAVPLRDEQGRPNGWVGMTANITEQKHIEELTRRSQKMEALSTLVAGVAHDFNNILLAIRGNAVLALDDESLQPETRLSLEEIRKAGTRAADLVRRFVAFSRPDVPRTERIRPTALVDETLKLLRTAAPSNITIETSFERNVPTVMADPLQIQQVLINLVTNAVRAINTDVGRITVAVGVTEVSAGSQTDDDPEAGPDGHQLLVLPAGELAPGRYVGLTVADTGRGVDASLLERMFEPFFTTDAERGGSGLGLAVVHGIIGRHRGAIRVWSAVGRGTRLTVCLPAGGDGAVPATDSTVSAVVVAPPTGKVAYIDDDGAVARMMARGLARLGLEAQPFERGADALEALTASPDDFAAVVTDVVMPGWSGFELVRAIRQLRHDMPIVVVSGHVTEGTHDGAKAAGAAAVLQKPFPFETLAAILADLMD